MSTIQRPMVAMILNNRAPFQWEFSLSESTTSLVNDWYQTGFSNNRSMNLYIHVGEFGAFSSHFPSKTPAHTNLNGFCFGLNKLCTTERTQYEKKKAEKENLQPRSEHTNTTTETQNATYVAGRAGWAVWERRMCSISMRCGLWTKKHGCVYVCLSDSAHQIRTLLLSLLAHIQIVCTFHSI